MFNTSAKPGILALTILLFSVTVFSQNDRFSRLQLSVGHGFGTAPQYINVDAGLATQHSDQKVSKVGGTGSFSASAIYLINKRFGLGLTSSVEKLNVTYENPLKRNSFLAMGLLATGSYSYISTGMYQVYSKLAVGITQFREKDGADKSPYTEFGFQVFPAGVRIGKTIGGFVELGFGYLGIVNAGLSLNL